MSWPLMIALYALAVGIRGVDLILPNVHVADGDWQVYSLVAHNILNGCGVSMSPAGSPAGSLAGAACVPHFGGNGLPGYPAFIAAVWSVLPDTKQSVLWAQVVVSALAVPRLGFGVARLWGPGAGLLAGLAAACSPLQAFMARYGLAEALTLGAANWLLAELALSLAARRLRILAVALPVIAAIALRLDSVVFLLPVATVGLWLHGLRTAIVRGAMLAVVIAIPLALWTARNIAVGVSPLPPSRGWMLPDGSVGPLGYQAWVKQWVTNEDQRAGATFFEVDNYQQIRLLPGAWRPPELEPRVLALLAELKAHTGERVPPDVDAGFQALADEMKAGRSGMQTLELRTLQGLTLWRSWAEPLPKELRPDGTMTPSLLQTWLARSFGSVSYIFNTATRFYRVLLGLLFLLALATAAWMRREARPLLLGTVGILVAKTLLGISGLFLEARYTVTAVPFIELCVALLVWQIAFGFERRRPAR